MTDMHDQIPAGHRPVTLLDVQQITGTGNGICDGIAVITVADADGEIDVPMMFNLQDSRTLALEMMRVLARHDDFRMRQILVDFFGEDDADFG